MSLLTLVKNKQKNEGGRSCSELGPNDIVIIQCHFMMHDAAKLWARLSERDRTGNQPSCQPAMFPGLMEAQCSTNKPAQ